MPSSSAEQPSKSSQPQSRNERLGHDFRDPALLDEALTHPSAASRGQRDHYERLEFLGDRVLGLIVAELLWR